MQVLSNGVPLSFGLELECYHLPLVVLHEPLENLGTLTYHYKDRNYKFYLYAEDSCNGLCLEIASFPCKYPECKPELLVEAIYELESRIRKELHNVVAKNQMSIYVNIVLILSKIPQVVENKLRFFSFDAQSYRRLQVSKDSISHCQINLGFSARQQLATLAVPHDVMQEKIVSVESVMLKCCQLLCQESITCNGVKVDYAEKWRWLARDLNYFIAYLIQDIREKCSDLFLALQKDAIFLEKLKWACFFFIHSLHSYVLSCSVPISNYEDHSFLRDLQSYAFFNKRSLGNRYNFGTKDLLPIWIRGMTNVFSKSEQKLFAEYTLHFEESVQVQLFRGVIAKGESSRFPDIGNVIIVELRNANLGHTTADINGKDNILAIINKFFEDTPEVASADYLKMPAKIPWRYQHYSRARDASYEYIPEYLEKKYQPGQYSSPIFHMTAMKIQNAWRRYRKK